MKLRGLLTIEEALACLAAGYTGSWQATLADGGSAIIRKRVVDAEGVTWMLDDPANDTWVEESQVTGLAPSMGNFLPMACAPRDGRQVILVSMGRALACDWVDAWLVSSGGESAVSVFQDAPEGWLPVVLPEKP